MGHAVRPPPLAAAFCPCRPADAIRWKGGTAAPWPRSKATNVAPRSPGIGTRATGSAPAVAAAVASDAKVRSRQTGPSRTVTGERRVI